MTTPITPLGNKDVLNNFYENVKYICDQWTHFSSDFENEFIIKSELDKQISEAINESVKTNLADVYITSGLIFGIVNAEDDHGITNFLEDARGGKK